jgi:hypothetical protein
MSQSPRFRLLAVDLDGTLLDSARRIPERNLRALDAAHRAGVVLALVTGRRLPAARSALSDLNLEPWLVLNGGALIQQGREGPIVARSLLPLAVALEVLTVAREVDAEPVVHDGPDGEGRLLAGAGPIRNRKLALYLEGAGPDFIPARDLAKALSRDPTEVMFASSLGEIALIERLLRERFASRIRVAVTRYPAQDFCILDVLAPDCSKSRALDFLARRHGVARHETMAIGDNWNDVDMLESAGLAVVMANAEPELRSRGFRLTASNDDCGVAQAIEENLL